MREVLQVWEHERKAVIIILGNSYDRDELHVDSVLLMKRRAFPRERLERTDILNRDHGQAIDIHGRTRQSIKHRNRKSADAMENHGMIECLVDFNKVRVPWLRWPVKRHTASIGRLDR